MSPKSNQRATRKEMPDDFTEETVKTITRIEEQPTVVGILYIKNSTVHLCSVPEATAQVLVKKLPTLNVNMQRALTEIDIMDELLAYRIVTKTNEILVAASEEYTACVVHKIKSKHKDQRIMKILTNLIKDDRDAWLVNTAVVINTINPIIDRIMEDDSVEGVVMTNEDGAPILTNISSTRATSVGIPLSRLGSMAQVYIKELDPFDEVLIMRIITKKMEMMVAPHPEFNIIVAQHARHKIRKGENKLDAQ